MSPDPASAQGIIGSKRGKNAENALLSDEGTQKNIHLWQQCDGFGLELTF